MLGVLFFYLALCSHSTSYFNIVLIDRDNNGINKQ